MKTILTAVAAAALLATGLAAHAADDAAATLADILVQMEHFPSDAQKAELAEIAGDSNTDEELRVIARAIADIEHQAPADAEPKLESIATGEETSEVEKTLAGAVLRFNHSVADQDADALAALAD